MLFFSLKITGKPRMDFLGIAYNIKCEACEQVSDFAYSKESRWHLLFIGIPLLFYTRKFQVRCNNCGEAFPLHGREIANARKLRPITAEYLDKILSEAQYREQIDLAHIKLRKTVKSWKCPECEISNTIEKRKCQLCGQKRPRLAEIS